MHPPAIFLMGPTASGKTELAASLVEQLPCEIISVDSALVYKGMDIGTAKPDAALLARAPHRLIDFLDPAEAYSAACFREDALREMQQISERGKIPLLVGGTMLYFRALEHGLASMPPADSVVRARIEALAQQVGWTGVHARLAEVDPESAERIHPNDPQRLQRALEVFELSGRPLSAFHAQDAQLQIPYRLFKLALIPHDKAAMWSRIEQRFEHMLAQGLIGEVEALYQRGDLHAGLASMRAVGYRQVWAHLEGQLTYAKMVESAVVATRQLAKRQLTWLRSEQNVHAYPVEADVEEDILACIQGFLGKSA